MSDVWFISKTIKTIRNQDGILNLQNHKTKGARDHETTKTTKSIKTKGDHEPQNSSNPYQVGTKTIKIKGGNETSTTIEPLKPPKPREITETTINSKTIINKGDNKIFKTTKTTKSIETFKTKWYHKTSKQIQNHQNHQYYQNQAGP